MNGGLSITREVARAANGCRNDVLVQLLFFFAVKWGRARNHLKDKHAKRPPVDTFVVRVAENNLGRNVVGCATKCGRRGARAHVLPAHAKVRNLRIQKDMKNRVKHRQQPITRIP